MSLLFSPKPVQPGEKALVLQRLRVFTFTGWPLTTQSVWDLERGSSGRVEIWVFELMSRHAIGPGLGVVAPSHHHQVLLAEAPDWTLPSVRIAPRSWTNPFERMRGWKDITPIGPSHRNVLLSRGVSNPALSAVLLQRSDSLDGLLLEAHANLLVVHLPSPQVPLARVEFVQRALRVASWFDESRETKG